MQDEFPIATGQKAQIQPLGQTSGRELGLPVPVRQFFRPCVLAFLALAIAIGANGYGHKLSQYFNQTQISKASGTRMWVEHRDDFSSTVAQPKTRPQRISGFALLALSTPRLARLSRDHAVINPAPARITFIISSHIPFRAPPSLHPSLA
ncbi:MAG: hypothetical protein WA354_08940 [Terracidiphilus sp.]